MDTSYANRKLKELIQENSSQFAQKMALVAYKMYGSQEDVPELQNIREQTKSQDIREKLDKLIELLKKRTKEEAGKAKAFAFVEIKKQGEAKNPESSK